MARKSADFAVARKPGSRASSSEAGNKLKPGFMSYLCYPLSHINKSHYEDGNKIIMPVSVFAAIDSKRKVSRPYTFEIINPLSGKVSHCGVLEFSAEEGFVYLPNWMMETLLLQQGQIVNIKQTSLKKGTYLKIQPHNTEFIQNLLDPRDVMERIFKDFACVTIGDTIMVNHENQGYYIDIVEAKPKNAVSLVDTDCELEFEEALDYKKPKKIKPNDKEVEELKETEFEKALDYKEPEHIKAKDKEIKVAVNLEKHAVFKPFTGVSRRLDGQVTATPIVADEDDKKLVVASKKHARTDVCGPDDNCSADNKNRGITKAIEDVKEKTKYNNEERTFQPFTGKKYTLLSG